MACKLLNSKFLPYYAVLLVACSLVFPGRDARLARSISADFASLRSDFLKLRADYDLLNTDFSNTLAFLRSPEFLAYVSGPRDAPSGGAGEPGTPEDVPGVRYMRASRRDGIKLGSDWWLVGDVSPWGVLESSYPGGFVADGRPYRCVSSRSISKDEL